jgi:hypothetical protein
VKFFKTAKNLARDRYCRLDSDHIGLTFPSGTGGSGGKAANIHRPFNGLRLSPCRGIT